MATEPFNDTQSQRFNFRRLIRYSIVLQILVIVLLLAVTLWGALQTRSLSSDLTHATRNTLVLSNMSQEFSRARAALQQYVDTGSNMSLGALAQSRESLLAYSTTLSESLDGDERSLSEDLTSSYFSYLTKIGNPAIKRVRSGRRRQALDLLNSSRAAEMLNRSTRFNSELSGKLHEEQLDADQAVSYRQQINAVMIVISGLVILGVGIGVLLWIRRETLVPLENLAVASRRLGHGDLSARVDPVGVEEVALTGGAFNQMADEIERHVGQLHELSVARSRFVSSVSHELRTPITSLQGYLDMLVKGEAGELSTEQMRILEIAERNASQFSELIDDLLTLSRIQSRRLGLQDDAVNLRDLLHELKTEMLPIGTERGIDVVLVDTGDLIVRGDRLRLRQAFGNLLSNAIKYSHDGQAVVVRALVVDRQAVISFVDWGVGISREDLPHIAEPFFRTDEVGSVPGTGLGLAIVKQMIELHGGRLAVESEPGTGSTFTVFLPLDAPVAGETTPAAEDSANASATTTDN